MKKIIFISILVLMSLNMYANEKLSRIRIDAKVTGFTLVDRVENTDFAQHLGNIGSDLFKQIGCENNSNVTPFFLWGEDYGGNNVYFDLVCPKEISSFLENNLKIYTNDLRYIPSRQKITLQLGKNVKALIEYADANSEYSPSTIVWKSNVSNLPPSLVGKAVSFVDMQYALKLKFKYDPNLENLSDLAIP